MNRFFKPAVHILCSVPFFLLISDWLNDALTANPIQYLTLTTGKTALILLTLSISVTPIMFLTGKRFLNPARKLLGLYAASYATLHFSIFVGLDYFFDWELIKDAIFEKPYVLAGFGAFIILAVMAITSTKGWKRRLKKKWKPLHRFVYLAAFLVTLHYIWLVKSDIREPLVYGTIMGIFLLLRIPVIKNVITKFKNRNNSAQTAEA